MFNFAYVRFRKDNHFIKAIVPIRSIKKFDSTVHGPHKCYMVLWTDGDGGENSYSAQILFLADSKEEINDRLANGPRMAIPKIQDSSVETETEDEEMEVDEEEPATAHVQGKANGTSIAKKKKEINTASRNGKRAALESIIKSKLTTKRKAVEEARPTTPSSSFSSSSSASSSSSSSSPIERKLRAEIARLRKENTTLNDLNRRLQEQVINHFCADVPAQAAPNKAPKRNIFHTFSSTSQPLMPPTKSVPATPSTATPEPPTEAVTPTKTFEAVDGEVHLADGVFLDRTIWAKISASKKHSIFVKDLSVALYGTEVLKTSSIEGKISPRHKKVVGKVAKPALCTKRLNAIQGCFVERLKKRNLPEKEEQLELVKMKRYIGEKIQDLNKK